MNPLQISGFDIRDTKTDNKSVANKIFLRQEATKHLAGLRVLDLYAGNNVLWRNFEKEKYFGIEVQRGKGRNLNADTRRVIDSLDLSQYNVIDCDSYGIAFDIYKKILESESLQKGTVILYTAIVNAFTQIQKEGMKIFGLQNMLRKCPTLFNPKGIEFFYGMLGNYGKERVKYYEVRDDYLKHYGYFIA
ncbi:MAG: hypothetical protein FWD49_02755 [Firmicutes bacterium]|nr:hypothetical protein [Bacillota bacterium]